MNTQISHHAATRQQQRGIPPLIMEWLSNYGACRHDHRGAEIRYFDKQSRQALARDVGEESYPPPAALTAHWTTWKWRPAL